jgi:excisionase family DNA binding protein
MSLKSREWEANKYHDLLEKVTTPSQVAHEYGIPVTTVIRWCQEGKIYAEQWQDGRRWLIAKASVKKFLDGKN